MNKLDAMEDVIMVGYPVGLWDSVNNRPIFRRGITATDPKVDFEGKKNFMPLVQWRQNHCHHLAQEGQI